MNYRLQVVRHSHITEINLCKLPTIQQGTHKTLLNPNQNNSHHYGGQEGLDEAQEKNKQREKERVKEHQTICCFLNLSIRLSVCFTGEPCGLVGQSPKFPGSAFGLSLMIAVLRQALPQLPQLGPRAQKNQSQHRNQASNTASSNIPVALVQLAISSAAHKHCSFSCCTRIRWAGPRTQDKGHSNIGQVSYTCQFHGFTGVILQGHLRQNPSLCEHYLSPAFSQLSYGKKSTVVSALQ